MKRVGIFFLFKECKVFNHETEKLSKLTPERRSGDRRRVIRVELFNKSEDKDCNCCSNQLLNVIIFVFSVIPGVILAPTTSMKIVAAVFFPYSYYLFVEKLMQLNSLL